MRRLSCQASNISFQECIGWLQGKYIIGVFMPEQLSEKNEMQEGAFTNFFGHPILWRETVFIALLLQKNGVSKARTASIDKRWLWSVFKRVRAGVVI